MTLIRGRRRLAQRGQASKTLTNWSKNKDHKDLLGLNKSRSFMALIGPFETPIGPLQTPFPTFLTSDVAQYKQKNIDHLL